jgi:hypothetical protein
MKSSPNGPRFRPADLRDPEAAHDALMHWDEQDEQSLRLLAQHPEHRGRLETLQRADRWLRQRATKSVVQRTQDGGPHEPGPDSLACPTPDELYDFGQGPGAGALLPARREAIDRHLATCLACEQAVATLATPPPSPLLLGLPEDEPAGASTPAPTRARRFRGSWGLVLAAAAGLIVALGVWRAWQAPAVRAAWPVEPLLRGEASQALLYPRERVLERTAELVAAVPAFQGHVQFEVAPMSAGALRIELFRHGGGAFDAVERAREWTAETTSSPAPSALEAGHYTWKAWKRDGQLDVELGSRDFEVVRDEALTRDLAAILRGGGADAGIRAVRLLHERGYRTDARALARTLPESAGRDAYLGRAPGR